MTHRRKKPFIKRMFNFNVLLNFFKEAIHIVRQGYSLKDKLILLLHYFKSPLFFFESLWKNQELIEIERRHSLLGAVVIKNKNGIFCCGKNVIPIYVIRENYEPDVKKYLKIENGTFVDVGAHIGKYTISTGRTLLGKGNVIALEPDPYNFELLKRNVSLNHLHNVILINKCAYSQKGKMPFYCAGKGDVDHSLIKRAGHVTATETEGDTLDSILHETKINNVKLIKIDTEGTEEAVLLGAKEILKMHLPCIIAEAWDKNYLLKIVTILKEFEYHYKQIDDRNYFFHT